MTSGLDRRSREFVLRGGFQSRFFIFTLFFLGLCLALLLLVMGIFPSEQASEYLLSERLFSFLHDPSHTHGQCLVVSSAGWSLSWRGISVAWLSGLGGFTGRAVDCIFHRGGREGSGKGEAKAGGYGFRGIREGGIGSSRTCILFLHEDWGEVCACRVSLRYTASPFPLPMMHTGISPV
jgi:hypothetical protein